MPVVPHSLVRLASGELAYITRRIDRIRKGIVLHMEDMCQLLENDSRKTKYKGSYEQVGRLSQSTCISPDLILFGSLNSGCSATLRAMQTCTSRTSHSFSCKKRVCSNDV
ncbi:MAG: HipA domain-containing protein [Ignavibacteria bacterium]|nr:HipA domain-containing protein [Ignavibacteria bacterium]